MEPERWMVFLLLMVLGAGVYFVNSIEDDAVVEYAEEVANFNELHHESILNSVLPAEGKDNNENAVVKRSSGLDGKIDSFENGDDHKIFIEHGRNLPVLFYSGKGVRMTRSSGQGIDEENPNERSEEARDLEQLEELESKKRTERSSGQGIDEENPDGPIDENANVIEGFEGSIRTKWSSGQGIDEEDTDGIMDENPNLDKLDELEGTKVSERSSGQGIDEENSDEPSDENPNLIEVLEGNARTKRSSGQRIDEENPEEPLHEYANLIEGFSKARGKRSSGQGIDEEDTDGVMDENPNLEEIEQSEGTKRSERSSGQGIDEENPDEPLEENPNLIKDLDGNVRTKRSSGQGIDEENTDELTEESPNLIEVLEGNTRGKRSSGQGIDEENPDGPQNENANLIDGFGNVRTKRSSGQGIDEEDTDGVIDENPNLEEVVELEGSMRSERSSGQGIDEENPDEPIDETPNPEEFEEFDGNLRGERSSMENTDGLLEDDNLEMISQAAERAPRLNDKKVVSSEEGGMNSYYFSLFKYLSQEPHFSLFDSAEDEGGIEEGEPSLKAGGVLHNMVFNDSTEMLDSNSGSDQYSSILGKSIENSDGSYKSMEQNSGKMGLLSGGANEYNTEKYYDISSNDKTLIFNEDEQFRSPHNFEEEKNMGNDDRFSTSDSYESYTNEISQHVNPYELNNYPEDGDTLADGSDDEPHFGYLLFDALKIQDDHERVIKLNKAIDIVLGLMNSMFSMEGFSINLPAVNNTFGHGITEGKFTTGKGYFKNPATLHRTGDVSFIKKTGSIGLQVALGLTELEAGFNHYDLNFVKIHKVGTVKISIAKNSLHMKITLTYSPKCQLKVDYIELDQLDGMKVSMTGLGAFQSLFDILSKWLLDNFTSTIKAVVNTKLHEKAVRALASEDICKYFPQ